MSEATEDVSILISGEEWTAWTSMQLRRSVDKFAEASFEAPFDPERKRFRDTFRPFAYRPMNVLVDSATFFTGTMIGIDPKRDQSSNVVSASGYSLPTVLQDCNAPESAYPLELNELKLGEIARTLLDPFRLTVELQGSDGAPFRRVALDPDKTVFSLLADLAKQRGLIIGDNGSGAVVFKQSAKAGVPVARFVEGEPPLTSVTPRFAPQAYFSEITGIAKARAGREGSQYTVINGRLGDRLRPHTFKVDDTDDADLPAAVFAKMGRMFGNMLEVEIGVPTWRDPQGQLFEPDTTVTLLAPGSMIYEETDFLVRDVTYAQDTQETNATLTLALPGAFSGEIPDKLPWEG